MTELDWRKIVADPAEIKIFEALEDHQWDWRTLSALTRVSGLAPEKVQGVVVKYPTLVRKSAVPGPKGEELYTLQSRYYARKSFLKLGWDFLSTTSSSS
jgi:hypothetical protein